MSVIDKIKEKGFRGCLHAVKCRIIKLYNIILFKKYQKLPIDENSIVLESEGDCCDNAYALFDYMKQNGYVGKYKITWFVDHPENFHDEENVFYVRKNVYEHFAGKTIKALRTCKWYIYDHNNILIEYGKRDGQFVECLWHGSPFKGSTATQSTDTVIDEVYSLSPFFEDLTAKFINCAQEKVNDLGYPRNDYFFKDKEYKSLFLDYLNLCYNTKLVLWMPTYRESINKALSTNSINSETGLPIISTYDSIGNLDASLDNLNIKLIIKVHHLQAVLAVFKKKYNNIIILKDEDLHECGLQLYQFIAITDMLITDYSSVFVDYLLLDKPIIFTLDDYEEYKKGRGFLVEDYPAYCPGHHVYNFNQLQESISDSLTNDPYKSVRNDIKNKLITYHDGNSSKRILEHIGVKL